MCGIVGYIGEQEASPIILAGLRQLEYRGYDSAGVSILQDSTFQIRKRKGKISEGLAQLLKTEPVLGAVGIGHTRWATHGIPSDENSHPHLDQSGRISLVHNGVIENFETLRGQLGAQGHVFHSTTDTEVLAHLVGVHYEKVCLDRSASHSLQHSETHPLAQAVMNALADVVGTYGIAVLCQDHPNVIVGARRGSPLIIGVGQKENLLASDAAAVVAHTQQVVYLNDHDVVTVFSDRFKVQRADTGTAAYRISKLDFKAEEAQKGAYPHYMLKEIFEQPRALENALRGRLDKEEATAHFGGLNMTTAELRAVDRILINACGTSWHAALTAEYMIEDLAHVPVEVEYASEFRYRNPPIETGTLVLVISQSGETADTLAGLRESRRRGHKVLSIVNVVGSTIARESDGGIYLHAGPEIGVASTKAFTAQVTVMALLALLMGRLRMLSHRGGMKWITALETLPEQMKQVLTLNDQVRQISLKYQQAEDFFFLGRQFNFPVALEGALKLKEISYIHAEGYPAAEMKHGPIAMIDERTPSVFVIPNDSMFEKTLSNLEEIKARKGPIIAVTTGDRAGQLARKADDVIALPTTLEPLFPLLASIPLQLLAYHIAVARGCDVDKPRNLAKSVTVE
ncbi:MAG: glutamine--fructose-6-phosphate transaminase (isomerizing) [Limisphaerales bacterium]